MYRCSLSVADTCIRSIAKPVLLIACIIFLSSIYHKIDITMLNVMASDEAVGFYSYAQKTVNIVLTMSNAVTAALLPKFLCAYFVIGIHTRPFQSISILLDKIFYYNVSNYAVPFFYACTGYFLIVKQPEKDLHTKLGYRIKKIFNIYIIWSIVYLPLTVYGWFIEGNKTVEYAALCIRNYILVGDNFYSWALWYLNGLIFALILIDILSKRISIEKIVGFGSVAYLVGIVLTAFGGHQDKLPALLAFPFLCE